MNTHARAFPVPPLHGVGVKSGYVTAGFSGLRPELPGASCLRVENTTDFETIISCHCSRGRHLHLPSVFLAGRIIGRRCTGGDAYEATRTQTPSIDHRVWCSFSVLFFSVSAVFRRRRPCFWREIQRQCAALGCFWLSLWSAWPKVNKAEGK